MTTPEVEGSGAPAPAILLEGVSKVYRLFSNPRAQLFEALGVTRFIPGLRRAREFRALDGVSLRVERGERVGLVGRNGAGKTTLLKLITGNFRPSAGTLQVRGEIQALMQMGLGFHPEFSGYDNVRAALDYSGLRGADLEAALEDVIDFVELGDFLHQPMKTYSMGMQARVQFAAATAIRPDILIVDEVLGAGDAYFSAKCARRMERVALSGCTLLLVSHSPQQVQQFCQRVVWLHEGKVLQDGPAVEVLNAYEVHLEHASEALYAGPSGAEAPVAPDPGEAVAPDVESEVQLADGRVVRRMPGNRGVKLTRLELVGGGPEEPRSFAPGASLGLELELVGELEGEYGLRYIVTFWRGDGVRAARAENTTDRFHIAPGETRRIRVELGPVRLGPGDYTISFAVYDLLNFTSTVSGRPCRFDFINKTLPFRVEPALDDPVPSECTLVGEWLWAGLEPPALTGSDVE